VVHVYNNNDFTYTGGGVNINAVPMSQDSFSSIKNNKELSSSSSLCKDTFDFFLAYKKVTIPILLFSFFSLFSKEKSISFVSSCVKKGCLYLYKKFKAT
jgi:hypothetical protein